MPIFGAMTGGSGAFPSQTSYVGPGITGPTAAGGPQESDVSAMIAGAYVLSLLIPEALDATPSQSRRPGGSRSRRHFGRGRRKKSRDEIGSLQYRVYSLYPFFNELNYFENKSILE